MINETSHFTSGINGPFWGAKARDWADIQEVSFRPVYDAVFERARLRERSRYLDVGCGAGLAAAMAAARGARVHGIDAAEGLLAIARARTPKGVFHEADLEALPHEDDTFDVVTGFNSMQYAGNAGAALSEAARVAKPGGRVAITNWAPPEETGITPVLRAIEAFLPEPQAAALAGPFALSDAEALKAFAADAGLTPLEVFDVEAPWVYRDLDTAIRGAAAAGVAQLAISRAGEAAVIAAYRDALTPFVGEDGAVRIGARLRCLVAEV